MFRVLRMLLLNDHHDIIKGGMHVIPQEANGRGAGSDRDNCRMGSRCEREHWQTTFLLSSLLFGI